MDEHHSGVRQGDHESTWVAVHDNHGLTPANWTGALIIMLASLVCTIGVVIAQPIVFWVGVALVVIGIISWRVMTAMGYSDVDAR